jgi:UDPglucose--hexose-1-phosphate uridylyltransferase
MGKPNENEVRFDPVLREWVIVAQNRTARPVLGKMFTKDKPSYTCPFCPDAPEGAGEWVVKALPNRFPSLHMNFDENFADENIIDEFYLQRPGKGNCEVILYTQDHEKTFGGLTLSNITALIELWQQRLLYNMNQSELRYSFIFENRGKLIGVSLSHPHGQIYSFPFIPSRVQRAVDSSLEYWNRTNSCLFCTIINAEKNSRKRIIEENENFIAFIPYYARWPFEIHIYPKTHYSYITEIPSEKHKEFAQILKNSVNRLDKLYEFTMPYVFSHHNAPYNSGLSMSEPFHYHVEIYPPYRAKDRIKYMAGVEMGTHTFINPTNPQENAKKLREIDLSEK